MMTSPRQIKPGTFIAATKLNDTPIRLYFQDTSQHIREFCHSTSSGWSGGTTTSIIDYTKYLSPLAVKEWKDSSGRQMRIFSINASNELQEKVYQPAMGGWDQDTQGHTLWGYILGLKDSEKFASFSKLASVTYCSQSLRRIQLYYQSTDRAIREICNDDRWSKGSKMPALVTLPSEGTNIASVGWGSSGDHIRVYVQDDDDYVWEYVQSPGQGWSANYLNVKAKHHSPLAAVVWHANNQIHLRLFYLDDNNYLQEQAWEEGGGWVQGPLGEQHIMTAHYSQLSAIMWDDKFIRIYYQPGGQDAIKEHCLDLPGSAWFSGSTLTATSNTKAVDFRGRTYSVDWKPYIVDLVNWRTYDPSTIDGVGILVGYANGRLIGEDLKLKESTSLKVNTGGNSYTWVYTPGGSIIYRWWDHDHRANYSKHTQLESGEPVICAGEFRIIEVDYIDSVVLMMNDASSQYTPTGSQCLGPVAAKLESLGISTANINWYFK